MSKQLVNLPNCNSCNTWSVSGGGQDNIQWDACTSQNNKLIPSPALAGGDGFISINLLQDALNNNYVQSLGSCGSMPDPNLAGYNQDCEQCFKDGVNYNGQSEGFFTGFVEPSTNPSCYTALNRTWSVQKPYKL